MGEPRYPGWVSSQKITGGDCARITGTTLLRFTRLERRKMRCHGMIVCGGLLLVNPLAAQDNPFAYTGGSVKSAYIVYDITGKQAEAAAGATWEMGVSPERWIIKTVMPFEIAGKKD